MKASTPALRALLASGRYVYADLYTITLSGGAVLRWTDADQAITANGNSFVAGPLINGGTISEKVGLEVATMTMALDAIDTDQINGVPLIRFIARRGFDGAVVKRERAFLPAWGQPATGTVYRFGGRVTSVGNIDSGHAEVTVSAWTVLLNVNMPANLYQVGCIHTVYDQGCGLDPENFAASGTVTGGASLIGFASGVSATAGIYAQGRIVFTSGANAGVAMTIRANDGAGKFTMLAPLPAVPAVGDAFRVYQGCDLTQATCAARFNNLGRFKATPFVPVPETALG